MPAKVRPPERVHRRVRRTIFRKGNNKLFGDEAYERIKDAILTMQLSPGQPLTEGELGARLGLGRMPVREALLRLAQEGMVTIVPRKGSFVTRVGIEDLQKIFELRLTVEGLSARLAAERITALEFDTLEALFEKSPNIQEGSEQHVRIDRAFHLTVARATKNEYLERAVEHTLNLAMRLLYLSGSRMSKVSEIMPEYQAVLDALRGRDPDAACRAMQAHIEEFRKKVRGMI